MMLIMARCSNSDASPQASGSPPEVKVDRYGICTFAHIAGGNDGTCHAEKSNGFQKPIVNGAVQYEFFVIHRSLLCHRQSYEKNLFSAGPTKLSYSSLLDPRIAPY